MYLVEFVCPRGSVEYDDTGLETEKSFLISLVFDNIVAIPPILKGSMELGE
jgi:hypothetical protein